MDKHFTIYVLIVKNIRLLLHFRLLILPRFELDLGVVYRSDVRRYISRHSRWMRSPIALLHGTVITRLWKLKVGVVDVFLHQGWIHRVCSPSEATLVSGLLLLMFRRKVTCQTLNYKLHGWKIKSKRSIYKR